MRSNSGGIARLAKEIETDLANRKTSLFKSHIEGLADLVATVLSCRNVNTSEWISVLPRENCDDDSKERYIRRMLANHRIVPNEVMKGYVPQLFEEFSTNGQTAILMMDQSHISPGFECLMISYRLGERAVPINWKVVQTEGAIGFEVQKALLEETLPLIPNDVNVLLAADRFYGTAALIEWCQEKKWAYRIRLKSNLNLLHEGGEITTGELAKAGMTEIKDARFGKSITHIGIIQEKGYPEPWIIAMDCEPSKYRTLDYGLRWGIEAMFSDFKSRGFSITTTKLTYADRIERLILILAIALYWAVSAGMKPNKKMSKSKKKDDAHQPRYSK